MIGRIGRRRRQPERGYGAVLERGGLRRVSGGQYVRQTRIVGLGQGAHAESSLRWEVSRAHAGPRQGGQGDWG